MLVYGYVCVAGGGGGDDIREASLSYILWSGGGDVCARVRVSLLPRVLWASFLSSANEEILQV